MVEQIVATDCAIMFDLTAFSRWNIPVAIVQQGHLSPSQGQGPSTGGDGNGPDSDQLDAQDVKERIADRLKEQPLWWILELLPLSYPYQDEQGIWKTGRR